VSLSDHATIALLLVNAVYATLGRLPNWFYDWRGVIMNRSHLAIIVGMGLISVARPASAQLPAAKPKAPLDNAASGDKSVAKAEANRIRDERRAQARSLLISLASDASSFRDQTLRARSLARIADTLWDVDAERGRTLFRKSWEAAEIGDRESQEPLNLRQQVLTLVVKRDRPLAEEFLEKLKTDQKDAEAENSGVDLWALSDALQQRLRLAESLLRTGDIERALQFADPVLGSVTISTVEFLTLLREKDPAAADQRYAAMLANTGGNTSADANTISPSALGHGVLMRRRRPRPLALHRASRGGVRPFRW
jgi:hypothetical protein